MLVTVVVVICHMFSVGGTYLCKEEIVTDSNQTPGLSFTDCALFGQIGLAKWKTEHPVYNSDKYVIERYKCVPGPYVPRGQA